MENNELMTEATTPIEEAAAEPTTDEAETTPQESEESTQDGEVNDAEAPEVEETFSLRVNHEDVHVSKDEVIRLAQIGKNHETKVKPMLDDLDYYTTLSGKTPKEFIKGLVDGIEKSYRQELEEELGVGNPLIEEMMELRRNKNKRTYEETKSQREEAERKAEEDSLKGITTRLAEQFEDIRELFPDIDSVEKVPDRVWKAAMKSGDLEKEMLRYERSERNKIEAANASQNKNKNQSIGSVASADKQDTLVSEMMRGIWG